MKTTFEISVREETYRKLRLNQNRNLLEFLKTAVQIFCGYNFTDASFVIFKLLYEDYKDVHNKILKHLGFTLFAEESFNPHVEYLFIEESSIQPIAEELQFQYMAAHPCFLKVKCRPGCEAELETLKNLMANHPLLLYRAVESVWNGCQNAEMVQLCIAHLLSEKNTSQVKGLEKLGHNPKHQQLLLPYAKAIGEFLQAMHKAFEEKQRAVENPLVAAAQEELDYSPFAVLKSIRDKVPAEAVHAPETKPATKVAPTSDGATAVNAKPTGEQSNDKPVKCSLINEYSVSPELAKFLDNKEALTFSIPGAAEFWERMAKLRREIGIDLNFLVDNLQIVLAVLSAYENCETATNSFTEAEQKHWTAMSLYTEKGDRESLQGFINAAGAFQEARDSYIAARESFVEHCNIFEKAVAKA